ncbi:1-deoxy-D-xylulose-5-phosphate synthase [Treponema sp. OttesenSCG-928-L16]|nr:1-deoxy-D-xylulose-5-phosphate synthase [Treponema sp. OttesenSCG-928-L16]
MHTNMPLLEQIQAPGDLRNLTKDELEQLAEEIRTRIVSVVSRNGGHLASNLGSVELTIALHRVFQSPKDKIVWDVGHQCYTHKLLTGRLRDFSTIRRNGGLSGFPKRSESPHDVFNTGHASTSISAALGILAAERISGGDGNAIAVIGDGALTGGLAYEALSHAGQLGYPLIVILNDNKMSIGPNVGGISKYLSRLSMKTKYQIFRRTFDGIVKKIPLLGQRLYDGVVRMKRGVKALFYTENFFVDLGFEYVGPIGGHDEQQLEQVLRDVRKLRRPVVVHVITRKGKGYSFAEHDPSSFHGVSSFSVVDGMLERKDGASFTDAFGRFITAAAEKDPRIVAVTAAMETGTGLAPFRKAFPDRFFDAGIAEEHAVTFAAGLASQGLKPVVAMYSTFMQRAADQLIHDVALQNLPVIFALDRAGFVGDDGETHQGLFDIALFRSVPNMTILAPADAAELELMFQWALDHTGPCIIRYPKAACPKPRPEPARPLEEGRGTFLREQGGRICIAFTGSLFAQAQEAAELLALRGISADLYNIRFLKPVDDEYLAVLLQRYGLCVFAEEGVLQGGFGEYAAGLAARKGGKARILSLGAEDRFAGLGSRKELISQNGLDGKGIADAVLSVYSGTEHKKILELAIR